MADDQQAQIIQLFEEAIDQPEATREQWLVARCAGNDALLNNVKQLLVADATASNALHTGKPLQNLSPPSPHNIGPYRVTETLGAGGMGIVYKAERDDGAFERTVAIKLVNANAMAFSDDARARFTNERQILARMSHPNIAQLLDGGTEDGRAYLVMEYVNGEPLVHDPQRDLETTLALFLKICDAVSYAHDNMVLHRDIKPANVLLNTSGETKLLDFGVAKINQTIAYGSVPDLTGAETAPMTLGYSAPERILGEAATIRSDVYSLGVYLFELLTGKRAYELGGLTLGEAHLKVCETDLATHFHGANDLRAIIAISTHTDPERRYASAADLARDIRSYLAGKPVSVRGDDWRYLFGRFVSRYRYSVAAGLVGLAVLVIALVITSWAYIEADRQTTIAEHERDTAEDAVTFLTSVLSSTDPWVGGEKELTVADILEQAEEEVKQVNDQVARAYVELALSEVHNGRGEYEAALDYAANSVIKLESSGTRGIRLARAYGQYGQALSDNDQYEQAKAILQQALDELAALPVPDWDTSVAVLALFGSVHEALADETTAELIYLRGVAQYETHKVSDTPVLAELVNNLGRLKHKQGDHTEAARRYAHAADLVQDNPVRHAIALGNLAGVLFEQESFNQAEQTYLKALEIFRTSVGLAHPDALVAQTTLASMYMYWGKNNLAEDTIAEAHINAQETLGEEHFITAYVQNVAAFAYCAGTDPQLGLAYAERSLRTRQAILPAGHWIIASGRSVLGFCAIYTGDLSRARTELESAYTTLLDLRGPDNQQTQLVAERLELLAEAQANQ